MTVHQIILPNEDCTRLRHTVRFQHRNAGGGQLAYCVTCTTGYEMAITAFDGDEERADQFVRSLRAEREAMRADPSA